MIYEYQVIYSTVENPDLKTILVRAETPNEAKLMVEPAPGPIRVHSVGPGRPIVDWSQPTWDTEEACLYLKCSVTSINGMMASGELSQPRKLASGKPRPVWRTAELDALLLRRMETPEALQERRVDFAQKKSLEAAA